MSVTLFIDGVPVPNGSFVDLITARHHPLVDWDKDPNEDYLVVFYDPDAKYLHGIWDGNGRELVQRTPPNPPAGETHHYVFSVFSWPKGPVTIPFQYRSRRTGFDIDAYNFGTPVGATEFLTGNEPVRARGYGAPYDYRRSPRRTLSPTRRTAYTTARSPRASRAESQEDIDARFLKNNPLTPDQRRFCACYESVQAKGQARSAGAVCAGRIGTSLGRGKSCSEWIDWEKVPDDVIVAEAQSAGIQLPRPYSRKTAVPYMKNYFVKKYAS